MPDCRADVPVDYLLQIKLVSASIEMFFCFLAGCVAVRVHFYQFLTSIPVKALSVIVTICVSFIPNVLDI